MKSAKIVGIGGLPRSGKDRLAELFLESNYFGISFGDFLRTFAYERHKDKPDPVSVANMTETSDWLRQTRGPDVILKAALEQFEEKRKAGERYEGIILWSIRAPVEVDFILAHHGDLIWLETDDKIRYERALNSLRKGEPRQSFEVFKQQQALQWQPQPGIPKEIQMNISYVKSHATRTLVNNGADLGEFLDKGKELIKSLSLSN